MTLRLDPRYPLVWRSPDTIQLGVDRPVLVCPGVGSGLERMVDALRTGVPRSGAVMLGRSTGASDDSVVALLDALRPVLLDRADASPGLVAEPRARTWVSVDGRGTTAARLRAFLGDLGFASHDIDDRDPARTDTDAPAPEPTALAVLVGQFAIEPARYGRWLRRDVPHLPVVFSDREVRIGPLVVPGVGPCLFCVDQARVDADPAWPALASQLVGRHAPTESPRLALEVAIRVAGLVADWLASGRSELAGVSLVIDAGTGVLTRRVHRPHARCGCRALPGTGIVPVPSAAGARSAPSSGRAVGVPA